MGGIDPLSNCFVKKYVGKTVGKGTENERKEDDKWYVLPCRSMVDLLIYTKFPNSAYEESSELKSVKYKTEIGYTEETFAIGKVIFYKNCNDTHPIVVQSTVRTGAVVDCAGALSIAVLESFRKLLNKVGMGYEFGHEFKFYEDLDVEKCEELKFNTPVMPTPTVPVATQQTLQKNAAQSQHISSAPKQASSFQPACDTKVNLEESEIRFTTDSSRKRRTNSEIVADTLKEAIEISREIKSLEGNLAEVVRMQKLQVKLAACIEVLAKKSNMSVEDVTRQIEEKAVIVIEAELPTTSTDEADVTANTETSVEETNTLVVEAEKPAVESETITPVAETAENTQLIDVVEKLLDVEETKNETPTNSNNMTLEEAYNVTIPFTKFKGQALRRVASEMPSAIAYVINNAHTSISQTPNFDVLLEACKLIAEDNEAVKANLSR